MISAKGFPKANQVGMNSRKLIVVLLSSVFLIFLAWTLIKKPMQIKNIDRAREALSVYFDLLSRQQYHLAMAYHGSGYQGLQDWNPDVNPEDYQGLLKRGCEISWQCLKIKYFLSEQKVSDFEFKFIVQFEKPGWSQGHRDVFEKPNFQDLDNQKLGKTNFEYVVRKIDNKFVVITSPVYIP